MGERVTPARARCAHREDDCAKYGVWQAAQNEEGLRGLEALDARQLAILIGIGP